MIEKPKRRWFQFTLLMALILLSLSCIAFAWFANERSKLASRRLAIERIKAVGGSVLFEYDMERPKGGAFPEPGIIELLYGDNDARADVVGITFYKDQAKPTDAEIITAAGFPHLRFLHVEAGKISDEVLEPISRLGKLRELSLTAVAMTPDSVKRLAPLQGLRELTIRKSSKVELEEQIKVMFPETSMNWSPIEP